MKTVESVLRGVRSRAWHVLKHPVGLLAKRLGYTLLSKDQTVAYLSDSLIATFPEQVCTLPEVKNAANPEGVLFRKNQVVTNPSHVWRYESGAKPTSLLHCGLLLTDNKVLNTDYWNDHALGHVIRPKHRTIRQSQLLLALLGHEFDGDKFVGYYDFMFLVAAKLCRLREMVPDAVFRTACVAYPLVNTAYEREFLALTGFGTERIFDSRRVEVRSEVAYLGNHDNWMHPNPADVLLLKKHLGPLIHSPRNGQNRIYVSRSGRRRVLNEEALIDSLIRRGFTIIDDRPRTLAEQYAIYHNASFIIGPHGASFTNLVWCEPGTHVLELFATRYVAPHFLYLAQVLGLRYSAYCRDADVSLEYGAIGHDMSVSIPDLERCLDELLPNH